MSKNSNIIVGLEVRVGNQNSIPVRYRGRTGFIAGTTINNRGTEQYLVSLAPRRVAPLALNIRQFSVV